MSSCRVICLIVVQQFSTPGETRTHNLKILSLVPLPRLGYGGKMRSYQWERTEGLEGVEPSPGNTPPGSQPGSAPFGVRPGAPERSRTPNLLVRSQVLYPVELRAHYAVFLDCTRQLYLMFIGSAKGTRRNNIEPNKHKRQTPHHHEHHDGGHSSRGHLLSTFTGAGCFSHEATIALSDP